jgi:hypothetical protein
MNHLLLDLYDHNSLRPYRDKRCQLKNESLHNDAEQQIDSVKTGKGGYLGHWNFLEIYGKLRFLQRFIWSSETTSRPKELLCPALAWSDDQK